MDYSEIYVKRIRSLCKQRGIAINKLATMSDVKQSTLVFYTYVCYTEFTGKSLNKNFGECCLKMNNTLEIVM